MSVENISYGLKEKHSFKNTPEQEANIIPLEL